MAALRHGEAYGYQILQTLGQVEGMAITESTVYPILARLAKESLVKVRVAPSPAGPPRRYYRLTKLGELRLRDMAAQWRLTHEAVDSLLKGMPDE